jgi:hypothetical protein
MLTAKHLGTRSLAAFWLGVAVGCGSSLGAAGGERRAVSREHPSSRASRRHPMSPADARGQILTAIKGGLVRRMVTNGSSLRADDLKIQTLFGPGATDATIELDSLKYDPLRKETLFWLTRPSAPRGLPLLVMAKWRPASSTGYAASGEQGSQASSASKEPSRTNPLDGPGRRRTNRVGRPLVFPGYTLLMVSQGQNYRTVRTVVPLERGYQGQLIRVKDPLTRQVLEAEVLQAGLLRQVP